VEAEQKCIRDFASREFLAQEFVDVTVGDFAGFGLTVIEKESGLEY
jgi:hypothetical protein